MRENRECTDECWPMSDTQLWLEVSRLARVRYLPISMATHHILANSASRSTDPARQLRFTEKAGELILHYLAKYPMPLAYEDRIRKEIHGRMVAAAYFANDRSQTTLWLGRTRASCGRVPVNVWPYLIWSRAGYLSAAVRPAIRLLEILEKIRRKIARINRWALQLTSPASSGI